MQEIEPIAVMYKNYTYTRRYIDMVRDKSPKEERERLREFYIRIQEKMDGTREMSKFIEDLIDSSVKEGMNKYFVYQQYLRSQGYDNYDNYGVLWKRNKNSYWYSWRQVNYAE